MKSIFIDIHKIRTAIIITKDGDLEDFFVETKETPNKVGNIYKGKVENVVPSMGGCFVNIGQGKNSFMTDNVSYQDDNLIYIGEEKIPNTKLKAGVDILCQNIKEGIGNKGDQISRNILLPGRWLILMSQDKKVVASSKIKHSEGINELIELIKQNKPDDVGFILRTQVKTATYIDLKNEMDELYSSYQDILCKYRLAPSKSIIQSSSNIIESTIRDVISSKDDIKKIVINDLNAYNILKEELKKELPNLIDKIEFFDKPLSLFQEYNLSYLIENMIARRVTLKNGGYFIIDKTEALIAIDVNSGKYVSTGSNEEMAFEINSLAAVSIAKQIRLQNLNGIILIDFINMKKEEHNNKLIEILNEEIKKDRIPTRIAGLTSLGLVEIARKKTRNLLSHYSTFACHQCNGRGYVISADIIIFRMKNDLLKLIYDNPNTKQITIVLNKDVGERLFKEDSLEDERKTIFKTIEIYIKSDEKINYESYDIMLFVKTDENLKRY